MLWYWIFCDIDIDIDHTVVGAQKKEKIIKFHGSR